VTFIEQTKNTHGALVEKLEVKRLLRKPRCRRWDNSKINLEEIR
jgi:hypothetical protein